MTKNKMKKPNWKQIYHDFKLVGTTIVAFALIISAYICWSLNERNQELKQENEKLFKNLAEIRKQYGQESIKLELKK